MISAVLQLFLRNPKLQRTVAVTVSAVLAGLAVILFISQYNQPNYYYLISADKYNYYMLVFEALLAIYLCWVGIRRRKWLISLFAVFQVVALMLFELGGSHTSRDMGHHIFVDKLNLMMIGIISIVGSLICLYAIPYMEKHHQHHPEQKDRRHQFVALLYLFLTPMYGIVVSNDLVWIYFFWEVTTLISYLLIRYPDSSEAHANAERSLLLNLLGGVCFVGAILYLGLHLGFTELRSVLAAAGQHSLVVPAVLLAVAGLTKAAQLPFSRWLLGAMVAPTPSSALLHSSTMVKAGVYLLIRISPLLMKNGAGLMVIISGSLTFLLASLLAISQSDAKKVLAYSTIANLGLIVACAGIGTYEALWAAVMLVLFHAVSKSLLFLTVGSVEQVIGSRDIEDMHGLIIKLPGLALAMIIGIAGMFLAPFGMLISKWAAMKAFIDSGNMIVLLLLVFGSAATLMYWTKWLGKIIAVLHRSERIHNKVNRTEYGSLFVLAGLVLVLCIGFPQISHQVVEPFLHDSFPGVSTTIISTGNQTIMLLMLGMIVLVPFGLRLFASMDEKVTTVYMSGVNRGDNRMFTDFTGREKRTYLSNWYLDRYFGERILLRPAIWLTGFLITAVGLVTVGAQLWR